MTQSKGEKIGEYLTLRRDGPVAYVSLDRGNGINALSLSVLRDLKQAAIRLRDETKIHVIVLSGRGGFSAGADLADPEISERAGLSLLELRESLKLGPDMCNAWAALDQVTIAAIERFCIGGGVSLAVSCDFRIMARDAHMRLPEIPLGMNMSWNTLPRLVALIGPSRTKQLTLFGERLAAPEAERWGLIDQMVEPGMAIEAATQWALRLARLPPISLRMSKRTISEIAGAHDRLASHMDLDQFALSSKSAEHAEAVRAFLEKRSPNFPRAEQQETKDEGPG